MMGRLGTTMIMVIIIFTLTVTVSTFILNNNTSTSLNNTAINNCYSINKIIIIIGIKGK